MRALYEKHGGLLFALTAVILIAVTVASLIAFLGSLPDAYLSTDAASGGHVLLLVLPVASASAVFFVLLLSDRVRRMLLHDQALLRESRERYRIALENCSVTLWDYDITRHTLMYDEQAMAKRGLSGSVTGDVPESLIASGYVHPESAEAFRELFRRIERGEAQAEGVFRVRTAQGEGWSFERIRCNCFFDIHNKPCRAIVTSETVTDDRRLIDKLSLAAECDSMTGLYNHDATIERIRRCLSSAKPCAHALFMVDIDNFKRVNDTLGHQCGDDAIKRIAERIKGVFRTSDIIGRVGGDEFMVLMKDVSDAKLIERKAGELVKALRITVSSGSGLELPVTASVGVSLCSGARGFDALYAQADGCLYRIKTGGKNSFGIIEE